MRMSEVELSVSLMLLHLLLVVVKDVVDGSLNVLQLVVELDLFATQRLLIEERAILHEHVHLLLGHAHSRALQLVLQLRVPHGLTCPRIQRVRRGARLARLAADLILQGHLVCNNLLVKAMAAPTVLKACAAVEVALERSVELEVAVDFSC